MGANFLFDGSAGSKEMLKLFLLYSDEGFRVSPPVYMERFFADVPGEPIGDLCALARYERRLDRAAAFVGENVLPSLTPAEMERFRRCRAEIADHLRRSEARACPRLESGEDGLTYEDLIHPQFFDTFASQLEPRLLETFKYRSSLSSTFAILAATQPEDDIAVTASCREIISGARTAAAVLLPRWDSLSLEDTMELKLRAHDELEELRAYLRRTLRGCSGDMAEVQDILASPRSSPPCGPWRPR